MDASTLGTEAADDRSAGRSGPVHDVSGHRSRRGMEALTAVADRVSVVPGRLGLHHEYGALMARQLLETDASFD